MTSTIARTPTTSGSGSGGSRLRSALELRSVPAAPAILLLVAVIFARPNVEGERFSLLAFGLVAVAAALALLRRESRPVPTETLSRAMTVLGAFLIAASFTALIKAILTDTATTVRVTEQDFVVTTGAVVAAVIALQDPDTRRRVGRGFVVIVAACCASYVVTLLLWAALGLGTGQIGMIEVGDFGAQPVYFPFTTTNETQIVFGLDIPRFTGLGREPGWMAMYCAAAFFLADAVGLRRWWLKALFLVGLLGTVSTAGFGTFVVVWAWDRTLRPRGGITLVNYLRQVAGLLAVAAALWLATDAPVLGLSAKRTQSNGTSFDDRQDATSEGFRALLTHPWSGGHGATAQAGINLVSEVAVNGLLYVLLIIGALVVPLLTRRRLGAGAAVAAVVLLTMSFAQPPFSSMWAFTLVALALGCDELADGHRARLPFWARRHRTDHPDRSDHPDHTDPRSGSPTPGGGRR